VLLALGLCASVMAGCSGGAARLVLPAPDPPCRVTALLDAPVRWLSPSGPHAGELNRAYCEAVGPVAIGTAEGLDSESDRGDLMIVSWNMAVGAGDLEGLLRTLEADERTAGRSVPEFVILLQEAYRSGEAVPTAYARYARVAGRIAHGERHGRDIASLAARLKMNFVYAPSMRNGGAAGLAPEDRGNAILSTLPLRDLSIVELPFEHQRRVAVAARVVAPGMAVTVASVHLDTRRPFWRGSIFAGPAARRRQAQALADTLVTISAGDPVIVAGDFNTLAGPDESAIRSLEQRFIRVGCGDAPTHRWGLHLDYVFASDAALLTGCDREDQRFGSDHHPLTARVRY
jgi:endonuclease/exonuclease/phosphatase family metal-dependent hydrolase